MALIWGKCYSLYCYLIYFKQAQGYVSIQREECASRVAEVIIVGLPVCSGCCLHKWCCGNEDKYGGQEHCRDCVWMDLNLADLRVFQILKLCHATVINILAVQD